MFLFLLSNIGLTIVSTCCNNSAVFQQRKLFCNQKTDQTHQWPSSKYGVEGKVFIVCQLF